MTYVGIRRVVSAAMVVLVAVTVALVFHGPASAKRAQGAQGINGTGEDSCQRNTKGLTSAPWGWVGGPYPVRLHGTKVYLKTDKGNAAVQAVADRVSAGDVLSIERSNFAVSGPRGYYLRRTSWIVAQSPHEGYSSCDWTATSSGRFSTSASSPVDGAHRYVRVCLRHNGVRQCAGDDGRRAWYGDNNDDWNDLW